MKKDAPIKKLYRLIDEIAQSYTVLVSIIVLCFSLIIVALISLFCHDYSAPGFW